VSELGKREVSVGKCKVRRGSAGHGYASPRTLIRYVGRGIP